jgi:formylglycine-generating enzyme required for sulfatase activity
VIGVAKAAATVFRPGQTFRDCHDCPEMVVVPAGSYTMGSSPNEQGREDMEGPQRLVSIRLFAVGKFVVTREQWATFASATNRATAGGCIWAPSNDKFDSKISWRKLGFAQNDNHPAVCVTWRDAQDYVHWLGQQTSQKYRLLSEAEWEYAARGGTTTAYPWGSSATHDYAN